MALVVEKTTAGREYKVKDMSRADFGRLEIELAEVEMPELVAYRSEFGPSQPFKGVKITASLHMTIKTAVLIETLTALGAEVRCCCCNIFSTQDHAAAAIARDSAAAFAWKGENLQEYWWCTERALDWGPGGGPDLIVDDGGDATLLIHVGVGAEEIYEKTGTLPDPNLTDNAEFQIVLTIIGDGLKTDSKRYYKMKDRLVGVSEEIATEVKRLYQMQAVDTLLFPTINVNDSVTKSKCDNLYGCRHFLPDGLMGATDVVIAGKIAVVCGYGNVGKGCASALKQAGAVVMVTEIYPICALQALLEGIPVRTLEDVISEADIFVNTTGNKDIIMVSDKKKMKNNAIVCNIGHFDNEIDMLGLENYLGVKRITIDPQTDSAREQDVINYEYTPIFIRSINKLVEVLLKLLQVMYSSDSSLIIMMVFILISFLYMAVAEVVIHVPSKSYCYVIRSIIYVSGVLTCALLLWILFPTFWLIIFLPCCAILFLISICVFQSIRQQIFEFIHDGIYVRLCNTFQLIFNLFHRGEAKPGVLALNSNRLAPSIGSTWI